MKILVTGGAGYIGSHIVKQLSDQKQHTILIVDNFSTGFSKTIGKLMTYDNKVSFINHDLSDWVKNKENLTRRSFDAVIHCAANLTSPESVKNPLKCYLDNTANSINLIQSCVEYGVSKFIFSSTAKVYANAGTNEMVPLMNYLLYLLSILMGIVSILLNRYLKIQRLHIHI